MLRSHNYYRSQVGVPALSWSSSLAGKAQRWANYLASNNQFKHSGPGENLWKGTSGAYSYSQMVGSWGAEKRYFKRGYFPNVSTTGNWRDVGHYTQVIWRKTTQLGCGGATGGGYYYLVCHYNPVGNVRGQPVYIAEEFVV